MSEVIGANLEPVLTTEDQKLDDALSLEEDRSSPLGTKTLKIVRLLLGFLILIFPICFGGVHPNLLLPTQIVVFCVLAYLVAYNEGALNDANGKLTKSLLIFLGLIIAWAALRYGFSLLSSTAHPVLGKFRGPANLESFWESFRGLLFFVGVFGIARLFLVSSKDADSKLIKLILLSGFVVSLIALSHWFYDNGRLFWIFEPDNVFESERARWPFVNANHLGHFLLPIFFLGVGLIARELRYLRRAKGSDQSEAHKKLSHFVSKSGGLPRLIALGFLSICVLSTLLAIIASQSRGSWLGLGIGLFLFLVTSRHEEPDPVPLGRSKRNPRSRLSNSLIGRAARRDERVGVWISSLISSIGKFGRYALWAFAAIAIYVFLNGRGGELVENRIEYGLLHSKEDIRWQMYHDSLGMIYSHLFAGVGLGDWSSWYPRYMDPLLSGINPVYLHSDPMQLLAELGLIGLGLACALIFALGVNSIRAVRAEPSVGHSSLMRSIVLGVLALIVASFVDFPFHIPAINVVLACCLAITSFYVDKGLKSASQQDS